MTEVVSFQDGGGGGGVVIRCGDTLRYLQCNEWLKWSN